MSSPNLKLTEPGDLEQITESLLPNVSDAVRWTCIQYQHPICSAEFDDFSQEILLLLIEDNCRRLHPFKCQSSFKTWLQSVTSHHISNCFQRQKQNENLDEIAPDSLVYLPAQDEEVNAIEKRKLLLRALSKLDEQERLLYQLYFVYELGASEIAARLKTEVKDIYKRKRALVLKLRRLVQDL